MLDLVVSISCVQGSILVHLHVAFVGTEPFFKRLSLLVDIDSSALRLIEEFPYLRCVVLVFESHIVVVLVRQEFSLVRLDRLLGIFDELNNLLGTIHLPKDVLDDGMVLEHWQHFKVVLVLSEQLLPESKTVNSLTLHRGFNLLFFA